ncbi:Rrp4p [Perkinsela sp. CCAP 1560/4]|nr:Rrp4p [Perkinsela sp. CCAP 1560/4]|eukprot:KNH07649.1 Rrp4p [Perkinsela sp. CCAP 1560/4]
MIKLTGEVVGNVRKTLKGINTHGDDTDNIISTVCGVPEQVDRFVSVVSLSSRYIGEVGDVVVGRVKEVSGSRWKVDIGAYQDGIILLSNVTLPGVLRKRERVDELGMRSLFSEGDIVVCEVQKVFHSSTISLHTRSVEKHGKMNQGFLFCTSPFLIPHTNKHFHRLKANPHIRMVIGVNGYIWVDCFGQEQQYMDMARVHSALTLLSRAGCVVHFAALERIVCMAKQSEVSPYAMLSKQFHDMLQLD